MLYGYQERKISGKEASGKEAGKEVHKDGNMIEYTIAGVAVLALIILIVYHVSYRRQVKELSRQLEFINNEKTEMDIVTDISAKELKKITEDINILKNKLKCTEKEYKSQDAALRETITNLSHDIRTPLTSLDGYLQFLEDKDLSEEKRKYYLDIINNRIRSLKDMLNELFTYAKLQDANYEIELSELDVTSLTAEIMVSFYDDIAGKGEEPEIHLPEEPVFIKGNREAYTRVVQNIIKNALVHGKNLCITLKSEAAGTIFECRDELMDPETVVDTARIFDRFYKADKARTNAKGSGLGLAITKELVERMGGQVSAECENGIFSIRVVLP